MRKKIYYHDTDAGGIVYYANYLKYLEEARTEFFEQRGLDIATFHCQGLLYAVRSCNITYKSPARYGDIIEADAKISKVTGAQIFFDQTVSLASDVTVNEKSRILVHATVALVCLDKNFKPQPIPPAIKVQCT